MGILKLVDVIIFSFVILSFTLLSLAIKAAVDYFSLQKKINERNQMLKKQFRITEDIF